MSTRLKAAARFLLMAIVVMAGACHRNQPPVARPMPPPVITTTAETPAAAARPPGPPQPVAEPAIVPPEPRLDVADARDEAIRSASLDDLNRNSPLKPAFYEYDSSELNAAAQAALNDNAAVLKKYPSWAVTIEGHCDERGTPEYNLALGERRAVIARTYLLSLGISADRLKTVSYGKEFPFDPGHEDTAFAKNRRAHFVITAK
jgi:peptidoglycan-associated lipoprotein